MSNLWESAIIPCIDLLTCSSLFEIRFDDRQGDFSRNLLGIRDLNAQRQIVQNCIDNTGLNTQTLVTRLYEHNHISPNLNITTDIQMHCTTYGNHCARYNLRLPVDLNREITGYYANSLILDILKVIRILNEEHRPISTTNRPDLVLLSLLDQMNPKFISPFWGQSLMRLNIHLATKTITFVPDSDGFRVDGFGIVYKTYTYFGPSYLNVINIHNCIPKDQLTVVE